MADKGQNRKHLSSNMSFRSARRKQSFGMTAIKTAGVRSRSAAHLAGTV